MGLMYWRYFGWNFIGRQNDLQSYGNPRDGNMVSGIGIIDRLFFGNQASLPDSARWGNPAYNPLYGLPFVLGVLGFFAQYRRGRRDWIVNGARVSPAS